MKVKIYCIIDINGLKYVGSTKQKLHRRLKDHKTDKKHRPHNVSSRLLDLDNCEMILLDECAAYDRKEKEQYWIDNTICVNISNTFHNRKQYTKQSYHYQKSWGGDKRYFNNLLEIDINLFNQI